MSDNTTLNAGSGGDTIATDDIGGVKYQRIKVTYGADGAATDVSSSAPLPVNTAQINGVTPLMGNGASGTGAARVTLASDSTGNIATIGTSVTPGTAAANLGKAEDAAHTTGDTGVLALAVRNDALASQTSADGDYAAPTVDASGRQWVTFAATTVTTTVTRPADTTAYAADDTWANSTSSPTTGGFTLTGMAVQSGGSGLLTDVMIVSTNNPSTKLQGEVWIFDTSVTAVNDNAAFTLSDADAVKAVAIVPFTLNQYGDSGSTGNGFAHVQGLNIGYTCSGSADLRFLVKVKNAYTPASGEALTVRAKCFRY